MQMKAGESILTRGLPKTGEIITEPEGCDGYYQAGWWQGLAIADNPTRFVAETLNGDDVVRDLATGLMWAADANSSINNLGVVLSWLLAVAFPLGKEFAGFSDWRLSNVIELLSIVNFNRANPSIDETLFPNTGASYYWTSTTPAGVPANVWTIYFLQGEVKHYIKTGTKVFRCVRGGV